MMEQNTTSYEHSQPSPLLANLDDHGRHLIQTIYEFLQIDEEWTQWHEDGFTWWSHRLAQRFRVEGPVQVDGEPTWWVSFETAVLRNVPNDSFVSAAVTLQNRTGNLFTIKVAGGHLFHWGRVYALPETMTSRARLLAERAIISNAIASEQADGLAALMRKHSDAAVEVDVSAHPENGARSNPDDMLNVVRGAYAPFGSRPLEIGRRPDLGVLADLVRRADNSVLLDDRGLNLGVTGTANGLTYGVHFHLTARHPGLGSGMLVLLSIPLGTALNDDEAHQLAVKLNDGEQVTRRPLISLGSWSTVGDNSDSKEGPVDPLRATHATFYPAASLKHEVAVMALADAIQRVDWLSAASRNADGMKGPSGSNSPCR